MQALNRFLIIVVTVAITACGGAGTSDDPEVSNNTTWSIIADAGRDRQVASGTSVQVSGEDSIETVLNKTLTYQWSIDSKPANSNALPPAPDNAVNPRFEPDVDGEYKLQLDVIGVRD